MRNILIGLLCLMPALASAQGLIIKRGFGAEIGYVRSQGDDLYGAGAGAVFLDGRLDAGIGYSYFADRGDIRVNVTSITPFVGFYPIRQRPGLPVSVRLGGSYERHGFSSSSGSVDDLGGYSLGGDVTVFRQLGARPRLIPSFGVALYGSHVDRGGVREFNSLWQFTFATSAVIGLGPGSALVVTPQASFSDDGDTAAGLTIGFVRGN